MRSPRSRAARASGRDGDTTSMIRHESASSTNVVLSSFHSGECPSATEVCQEDPSNAIRQKVSRFSLEAASFLTRTIWPALFPLCPRWH